MDPLTLIALASGLVQKTGLGDKIGSWLGGDKGAAVADKVLDVAQSVTGLKDPKEAAAALHADRQLMIQFEQALLTHEEKLATLAYADIADARDMQKVALKQEDAFSKRFMYYFAFLWSIFSMSYVTAVTFCEIPAAAQGNAQLVLGGVVVTSLGGLFQFFFGSSSGSHSKGLGQKQVIDHLLAKQGAQTPALPQNSHQNGAK
ncbi:hypothetical protein ACKC9G_18520 [Pokkaliibacter sp. CJK22405]|uniref:hypothetical protein n=1 Tax=Pokkaliibacter sp. CJK22405 TaxID=3384615 RepID=UPI003984DE0E